MNIENIIFDLDGTLIDSSASILASFQASFDMAGLEPTRQLDSDIIGPPLKEALALLASTSDPVLINSLAENFRDHYDSQGYREATIFPGISDLLIDLAGKSIPLHIATDKRIKPTALIVQHFGWSRYFSSVFGLDSLVPSAANKADLISHMINTNLMDKETTIYVGDRLEDANAAKIANVVFFYASWGYGSPSVHRRFWCQSSPATSRKFAEQVGGN